MLATLVAVVVLVGIVAVGIRARHDWAERQRAEHRRWLAASRVTEPSHVIIPPTKPKLADWQRLGAVDPPGSDGQPDP